MVQHGYYKVKNEYFELFSSLYGSKFKFNKDGNRPVFYCFEDKDVKGLYWAIPTGNASNKDLETINKCIISPKKSIRYSYYHLGRTNKDAIFYISSAYPITEKYIEGEYTSNGSHLITKNDTQNKEIASKLKNIIAYEKKNPNRFEQRKTDIRNYLIEELEKE